MIKDSVLSSQSWNKCIFNAHLNDSRLSIALMLYGGAFHSHGAVDEKARSPYVLSLVFFAHTKVVLSADLKLHIDVFLSACQLLQTDFLHCLIAHI